MMINTFSRFRSWLRATMTRRRMERDMDEELRFHIDQHAEDLRRSGLSPQEARRQAAFEFGVIEARKDECRDALGLTLLDDLRADVKYAIRTLRRSPAFSAVAILSLALGIGANTAIFSLMEAVLWKAIPVSSPEQLRLLTWVSGPHPVMDSTWDSVWHASATSVSCSVFSYATYEAMRHKPGIGEGVFGFKPSSRVVISVDGNAQLVDSELVSGNFYSVTGLVPIAGRPIIPSDDAVSAPLVAVISDGFWASRFGREASAIGKRITLNHVPAVIVGVNPSGFNAMETGSNPEVFLPLSAQPAVLPFPYQASLLTDPDTWWIQVMVRLRPGMNEQRARAALNTTLLQAVHDTLPRRLHRDMPRLGLITGSRGLDLLRTNFEKPVLVLLCVAGLVLLIACANVANLLLARATARHREIGVRLALGARRRRVVRQMLTEGLVLAGLGGAAGLLLGYWVRNGIPSMLGSSWSPGPMRAAFNGQVLGISIGITLLTGILFSVIPAWRSTNVQANTALKEGGRAGIGKSNLLAGRLLVVFQICLSVMLLVGSGLFIRTLINLKSVNLGFNPEHVLLFDIDPPLAAYPVERRRALFQKLEQEMQNLPGVRSATASTVGLVANNSSLMGMRLEIAGTSNKSDRHIRVFFNEIGTRFFETMGIPLLSGRAIDQRDRPDAMLTAVVNREFVRQYLGKASPLGDTLVQSGNHYRIVGVCEDAHYVDLREQVPPTVYLAAQQAEKIASLTFELKTAARVESVIKEARLAVRKVDPDLPIFNVRTQTEQIDATVMLERLFAALTAGFGILALLLAAVGVYGVMAYMVARRTNEIGIRVALGAQRSQVLGMILRESAALTALGIPLGLAAALGVTRYIRTMLYGLTPTDPLTFAGVVALLIVMALVAGWWPARKAALLDPVTALRHE